MAKSKPTTPETFLAIRGIGEKFVQSYGDFFLEALGPFAQYNGVSFGQPNTAGGACIEFDVCERRLQYTEE